MAILQTLYAKGSKPTPVVHGSEVMAVRFDYDITAVLASADVVQLGFLPANHRVVDWAFDCDYLSASAAGAFDLGILSAGNAIDTTASGGAAWVSGATVVQAGGLLRAASATHTRVVVSRTADQKIGLVMTASCTTTAAGKLGLTVYLVAG